MDTLKATHTLRCANSDGLLCHASLCLINFLLVHFFLGSFIDQRLLVTPLASKLARTHVNAHMHSEFRNDIFSFVTRSTKYCETSIGTDSKKGSGTDSHSMRAMGPDDLVCV